VTSASDERGGGAPRGGRGARVPWAWAALALAVCASLAPRAHARVPLVDSPSFSWTLGGYARNFSAYQLPHFGDLSALPPAARPDERVALQADVFRLEWRFRFGDVASLEVHDRLFWVLSSSPLAVSGAGLGVGATPAPERWIDLSTDLVSDPRSRLEHDLDRLALRLYLGPVDVTLGRQAITWGTSSLFTVADVWAAFSPFDLDTSQKRGVDAVRAVMSVGQQTELDLVVADRGRLDDLSAGLRATFYLDFGDVYAAAGKFWEQLGVMAGVSASVGAFKLRAEAALPYDLDASEVLLPRVTLGADWLHGEDLVLSAEAHFNGLGTGDAASYAAQLTAPVTARGQSFLLGRWYAGVSALYKPHELVQLTLTPMVNLGDPSALIAWAASYELAASVNLSVGGFHGLGEGVALGAQGIALGSELGSYGQLLYIQLAAFF